MHPNDDGNDRTEFRRVLDEAIRRIFGALYQLRAVAGGRYPHSEIVRGLRADGLPLLEASVCDAALRELAAAKLLILHDSDIEVTKDGERMIWGKVGPPTCLPRLAD